MLIVFVKLSAQIGFKMLVKVSLSLLMIVFQFFAPPIGMDCSLNVPHFMVNTSKLGMSLSIFIIYFKAFFKVLERLFKVSLTLIDLGEAMKSLCITFFMIDAFCKAGHCLLISVEKAIYLTDLANHKIILRLQVEILKKILKCFLLVRRKIYISQSTIGLTELRINLNYPCKAINCFFLIRTLHFKPITAVAFIIAITSIDASYLPQSKNMLGIKLKAFFIFLRCFF